MTLGEIKIEAFKLMFVNYNQDLLVESLEETAQDENYGSYYVNMPGSINRAFSNIEQRKVLPTKSRPLILAEGTQTGNFVRYDLSRLIEDFYSVAYVVRQTSTTYERDVHYIMEGKTILLPYDNQADFVVMYYPSIKRVTAYTPNTDEVDIPEGIACNIPYYIKGDLYRNDEPNEASEARNWFESAMTSYEESSNDTMSRVVDTVYSM